MNIESMFDSSIFYKFLLFMEKSRIAYNKTEIDVMLYIIIYRYAVSLYVTHFCVRLYWVRNKGFWWFFVRPLFTLYFAVREILQGIKQESSLSLNLLPFTLSLCLFLSLSFPFTSLSVLSLSFSLAYLMDVYVLVLMHVLLRINTLNIEIQDSILWIYYIID